MHIKIINSRFKQAVCMVITALALTACGSVDEEQSVASAKQYLEQNELREASLELRNALQANPDNAEARYLLGELNITFGDMASAAKDFRKARDAGWDKAEAELGIMRALVGSHQFRKALDSVQIDPSYSANIKADLYGLQAFATAALGDIAKASSLIGKGKDLDASAFQVLKTGMQLDYTAGNVEAANKQMEAALIKYNDSSELLMLSAYGALQANDIDRAKKQFEKVLQREPESLVTFIGRSARLGYARLEIDHKNYDEAKALLKPLFKQSPNDPETNYIGALLAFEKGAYNLAEERILKVLKNVPEHTKTQLLYGTVHFSKKDYEQASYYLNKYLTKVPSNTGARKLLARTYMLMGKNDDANATLQPGLAEGGDDAELLALVGLSQLQGGNIESGIAGLQSALSAAPGNKGLQGELAKAYITAGETEKAISQLNALLADGGNKNQAQALKVSAYLRAEQFDEAIGTALEMLADSPDDEATIAFTGNVFAASGDSAEARKYFNKALEVNPKYSLAIMLLASLEETEENYVAAEQLYRKNLTIAGDVNPMLALARLAGKQGDNAGMRDWLEKARKKDENDLRSRLVLAEMYLRENKPNKVELIVKEVVDIAPSDARVLALQGRLAMVEGRYNEALKPLKKLVKQAPDAVMARVLLGESYLKLGQLKDAQIQTAKALEVNEFEASALLLQSTIELQQKNHEQAIVLAQKVQKLLPEYYLGYEAEGNAYVASKRYQPAVDAYSRAMLLQPSSNLVIKMSGALVETGDVVKAREVLKDWTSEQAEDINALQFLGSVQQTSGLNDAAISTFEKINRLRPENIVSLNNLAWLYTKKGDSRAVDMAEKAYKKMPENPGIQDTYGWVLVNNGQPEKGRQLLEQALKALPEVADVQFHYATALARTGQQQEAKKRLKRVLQSGQEFDGREEAKKLYESMSYN